MPRPEVAQLSSAKPQTGARTGEVRLIDNLLN